MLTAEILQKYPVGDENRDIQLILRVIELEKAIKIHRQGVRSDPCWSWDTQLWEVIGDNDTEWAKVTEGPLERVKNCILYLETHEVKFNKTCKNI